jgi:hypothetical protein
MMRSPLFEDATRELIESNVIELLNGHQLMNKSTVNSPRAVGDAVQLFLETNFPQCIPTGIVQDFSAAFARRSMADFAFTDKEGRYFVIDNKTHNLSTQFNMPNLTSVERLARFYGDDNNYFTLLIVSYKTEEYDLEFSECKFVPIEYLEWDCLTLGALGWGQIQIANSNIIKTNSKQTRRSWMLQLCDALDIFYPNEIEKITERIGHFKKIREFWNEHPDN